MVARRVVTGFDAEGRPAVLSDEEAPVIFTSEALPGYMIQEVCMVDAVPAKKSQIHTEARQWEFEPKPGSVAWRIVVRPPESSGKELEGLLDEIGAGAGRSTDTEAHQPGRGGTHKTSTLDWMLVISGEVWMTIGEGPEEVHFGPGDCIVQGGIPHAWHNRGTEPCIMAGVMLGVAE